MAFFAVAYALFHHEGWWLRGLGTAIDGTRWADWVDLLTPWLVLVPALLALRAARADRMSWALAVAGVLLYVEGHGIHLAANSVGNVAPGPTAHLWDEVIGHWLWYGGFALVVAALGRALRDLPPPHAWWAPALAVAVGITWATNSLEGGTVVLGLGGALAAGVWGRRRRGGALRLLLWAACAAVLVICTWGVLHAGFPQPSQVGRR